MARIGVVKSELSKSLIADRCPKCGKMSELQLRFVQNVVVVALPLFPMDKKVEITCNTCKYQIPLHLAPKYVFNKYEDIFPTLKTRKWTYTGSILFGAVIVFMLFYIPIEHNRNTNYIETAKVGDIYTIKYKDRTSLFNSEVYSMLKVVAVTKDSVAVLKCNYEKSSSDLSGISKSDEDTWSDDAYFYSKDKLQQMVETLSTDEKSIEITDVDRAD